MLKSFGYMINTVVVVLEARFLKNNGAYYGIGGHSYDFWKDYLQIFPKVVVAARVFKVDTLPNGVSRADGPGVSFMEFPGYVGPYRFLLSVIRVWKAAKILPYEGSAFVLRIPSTLSFFVWLILKKKSAPYCIELLGDAEEAASALLGLVPRLIKPFMVKFTKAQCAGAQVCSYCNRHSLKIKYPPSPGVATYIYTGIRLEKDAIRQPRAYHTPPDPLKIIYVASMAQYKGHSDLLEALAICRQMGRSCKLTLLGDGPERANLEDLADSLEIRQDINFLGRLPSGKAVCAQLDKADVFVSPSRTEGTPKAVIEAMARGLPVILSNIAGHMEFIADENSFEVRNPESLARKLIEISRDESRLSVMSRDSVTIAGKYTQDILGEQRRKCYLDLKLATQSYWQSPISA
jgi:glycosyltransferase involved in cell wall biosynthesis